MKNIFHMNRRFRWESLSLFLAILVWAGCALAGAPIQHRFLIMDFWKGKLMYVDEKDGANNWAMPGAGGLRDFQLIGQNRLLVSCEDGYTVYDLISHAKVDEFHSPLLKGTTTVRRRKDGSTWVGTNQGKNVCIYALDSQHAIRQTITLPNLKWLRNMRFSSDNTLLLAEWDGATEISTDPNVAAPIIRRFQLPRPRNGYMALKAADGTVWVAGGYAHGLFQYAGDGKLLREFQANQPEGLVNWFYAGFQFLGNGHIVQSNWTGHGEKDFKEGWKLIEFDGDGQVVWHWYVPREQAGSINGALVLDDLDISVFHDDLELARCFAPAASALEAKTTAPVPKATPSPAEIAAALEKERQMYVFNQFARGLTPETLDSLRQTLAKAAQGPHAQRAAELGRELEPFANSWEELSGKIKAGPLAVDDQIRKLHQLIGAIRALELDAPLLFLKRNPWFSVHIYDDYFTWRPGGGIYVIENPWDPMENQVVRAVIDPTTPETLGPGVYRDPSLSFDAKKLLFAFKGKPTGDTSIYEIGIDGKGLRRITDPGKDVAMSCAKEAPGTLGSGQHDITPAYLPDGRIVFTSTRTGAHVMCFSSRIDTLHTMNADGTRIRCISVNNQTEFNPTVMPDGRILYGRWEYVDKTALYMQSLWLVDPDGSGERAVFKNNLAKPTTVLDARPVPGTDLIVASLTPHDGQSVGAIGMIDVKLGKNNLAAITNFTPEYPTAIDQGVKYGPCDPWPLSANLVLIANNAQVHGPNGVIELIGREGFRVTIHSDPKISCFNPMLVKPRPVPPVRPSLIRPGEPARFLVLDLYQGMDGVAPGSVKQLRILETTARTSGIPKGGRWWNQAFLTSWQGSYDIKNFLGVVPVQPDGSAFFEAPPGKALYFQALDKEGRMLSSQRTFVQAVPGITRSCTGCHLKEDNRAPVNRNASIQALKAGPAKIQPETWGSGFLDYPTQVQPILDRNCVSCHGGEKGMASRLDLSGGWTWAFNISYESLLKNTLVGFLNCADGSVRTADILPPRTHGSGAAPLAEVILSGHKDRIPNLTPAEKSLLLAWMDGNCNYYGTWNYSEHAVCNALPALRNPLIAEMEKAGCVRCHEPEIGNDWVNLQNPERSRILRAPLAKGGADAGLGLAWCRDQKAGAPFKRLIINRVQSPDVFRPAHSPKPLATGTAVTPFASIEAAGYKAMLTIITKGREEALKAPRVDMPGAQIIKGECRELKPLTPPGT